MRKIENYVDEYPIVAMDTEFPGEIAPGPHPSLGANLVLDYEKLKMNVDQLKLIQLGLKFVFQFR
jgi:CCR4-NOT transcription complex subunit 7/8